MRLPLVTLTPWKAYPCVGSHPIRKVVWNVSLPLTEVTNGISLEANQVIFNLLARVVMDYVSALDLLLTYQDRVCTITNAIFNILGQVEVTVIGSSKSMWTKAGSMIVVFILNLLRCCGLALYVEQFGTQAINLLSLITIIHEYKGIPMTFPSSPEPWSGTAFA